MLTEHEISLRVRYQETDPMGFLHHAYYFTYFEIGRRSCCAPPAAITGRWRRPACWWWSSRPNAVFAAPPGTTISCGCARPSPALPQAKIEHQYELFRDQECLAIGHVTLAVIDRAGRVQPVPEWMKLGDLGFGSK